MVGVIFLRTQPSYPQFLGEVYPLPPPSFPSRPPVYCPYRNTPTHSLALLCRSERRAFCALPPRRCGTYLSPSIPAPPSPGRPGRFPSCPQPRLLVDTTHPPAVHRREGCDAVAVGGHGIKTHGCTLPRVFRERSRRTVRQKMRRGQNMRRLCLLFLRLPHQ